MWIKVVVVALLPLLGLADIAEISTQEKEELFPVDTATILRAVGTTPCMKKCIDPFIESMSGLWTMQDVLTHAKVMCKARTEAAACLKKSSFCDTQDIFGIATSSAYQVCERQWTLFSKMEPCLKGVIDNVMQDCDGQCFGRSNLSSFSTNDNIKLAAQMGGNIFMVSDHISGLCSSLTCAIPCITTKLNAICPLSGWLMLDVILQPLETTGALISRLSPPLQDLIKKKITSKCHFLINPDVLLSVRKGNFNALTEQ